MAIMDSVMEHEHDTDHQKATQQVPTTRNASFAEIEHGSGEKVTQKVVQTNKRADSDPRGRSPQSADESPVKGLSNEDLWMLLRRFDKVSASALTAINRCPHILILSSKSLTSGPYPLFHHVISTYIGQKMRRFRQIHSELLSNGFTQL